MTHVLRTLLASALLVSLSGCSGDDPDPGTIGVGRDEAACRPIVTKDFFTPPNGSHHLPDSTTLSFDDAPPAAALHHGGFPTGSALKNIYSVADRPPVSDLVHLTEHGYNLLWYDDTIAGDDAAMDDLQSLADAYPIGEHFVITPWTAEDGPAFPDGAHVALTHWTGPENMQGIWEYCNEVSGEVVDEFTAEYTKSNSPEPLAP